MLVIAPAYLAYHQHIRVVKMTGLGIWAIGGLAKADAGHAAPGIVNVAGTAPAVAANFGTPLPNITHAVLAKAEHNIAQLFIKRSTHYLVGFFNIVQSGVGCSYFRVR